MLRRSLVLLAALALVPVLRASVAVGEDVHVGRRYIVVVGDASDAGAVAAGAIGQGSTVERVFSALNSFVATLSPSTLAVLRADPRVSYVAADRRVRALADPAPAGIRRVKGSPRSDTGPIATRGNPPAAVAIVDSGIGAHPDLNLIGGVDCVSNPITGLVGPHGFSDANGHGTHVAGIAAARADQQGTLGVSPGSPLYAVRVLNALGLGNYADIICGLDWVATHAVETNIKVVNMSIGGRGFDDRACGARNRDPFHAAVCQVVAQGVTVVVAAGNSGEDLTDTIPAAYGEVLTVTAMADFDGLPGSLSSPHCETSDRDDTVAGFSNFARGDADHTIAAPGVCVYSTWLDGGYKTISGTSMAAPHVAGAVAACIDAGPCAGLPPSAVIETLRADAASRPANSGYHADPNSTIGSRYYGHLVDAHRF